jgi:hypothetical protein
MLNYMNCSQMMFGTKVRYAITFKAGEPELCIYQRKYFHHFMVQLNTENYEGSYGCNLSSINMYAIAKKHTVEIYD